MMIPISQIICEVSIDSYMKRCSEQCLAPDAPKMLGRMMMMTVVMADAQINDNCDEDDGSGSGHDSKRDALCSQISNITSVKYAN